MTAAGLRRLLHASTGAVVAVVPLASWTTLRWITAAVAIVALIAEIVRLRVPAARAWLSRRVPVYRPHEATRPSGAFWLCWGYALAAWVPPPAPAAGILVGALADPAAATIGSTRGRNGEKTWRGTAAVAGVAVVIVWACGFRPITSVLVALVAASLERWPGRLDDNLVVAPGVAAAAWLLNGLRA